MRRLLARIRQALRPRDRTWRIIWDDAGFQVVQARSVPVARGEWSDVVEVFAYKRDLYIVDDISIGLRSRDGRCCQISEDDIGYREFLAELERRFPSIRTDWFMEVAFPAFETNRTTLWGSAPEQADG